ncbi:hypothetical protein GCM10009759_44230 [Kitasatospora saccharophila]|uniref:Uncharacterized protein n=1 Tax=Kitasatospora saccharophila TaxID=407973 RepID=A0ABN2X7C8_9ACTN
MLRPAVPPGLAEGIAARRFLAPEDRSQRAEQERLFTRAPIGRTLGGAEQS